MKRTKDELLKALREATMDEGKAVEFIEARRWGDTPCCPKRTVVKGPNKGKDAGCGSTNVYQMTDRKTGEREKNYRWRCRDCGDRFTVRSGSIFESTRLPLSAWCHAYWRAVSSKKGVSALQISRELEISYKSALFLMHRIREAVGPEHAKPLGGEGKIVEADETYHGGKPRNRRKGGQGKTSKRPIFAVVERGGDVRFRPMERVTAKGLADALQDHADAASRLMTDEAPHYGRAGKQFAGGHGTTHHRSRQYALPDGTHSNTAESVFALFKRAVYGTHHSISRKHLRQYLKEREFAWNTRNMTDAERAAEGMKRAEGKRLTYEAHTKRA